MNIALGIRDEVYLRIATKQTAGNFYFANDFILEKTWRPWETLENLFDPTKYPSGKVYVIGGRPGDMLTQSRDNVCLRDYPVQIGFQHPISKIDDDTEIDTYAAFVEELEETCRIEVDTALLQVSFSRIEPMRDPNGIPMSYIMMRDANVFEAYFTVFYTRVLGNFNEATTTTT